MNEYSRILILTNYIEMLKRKDSQEITEFINNPKRIQAFLYAMGANKKFLELPAHREKMEECLKFMTNSAIEAIRGGEEGLEVKYLENGLEAHREGIQFEERTSLQFDENSWLFNKTSNRGETLRRVKGDISKNIIATYSKKESLSWFSSYETIKTLSEEILDEAGFVISESSIESQTGSRKNIERNGLKITNRENVSIRWDGNPSKLNEKSANGKEFCEIMSYIIDKYPNTQAYYEEIVGKDFVVQALETMREKK